MLEEPIFEVFRQVNINYIPTECMLMHRRPITSVAEIQYIDTTSCSSSLKFENENTTSPYICTKIDNLKMILLMCIICFLPLIISTLVFSLCVFVLVCDSRCFCY